MDSSLIPLLLMYVLHNSSPVHKTVHSDPNTGLLFRGDLKQRRKAIKYSYQNLSMHHFSGLLKHRTANCIISESMLQILVQRF